MEFPIITELSISHKQSLAQAILPPAVTLKLSSPVHATVPWTVSPLWLQCDKEPRWHRQLPSRPGLLLCGRISSCDMRKKREELEAGSDA